MKNSKFIINIGDLLLSAGKRDEISFENENLAELTGLDENGIKSTVIIQSFDQNSLLVTLQDLQCHIKENCDKCNKGYTRSVHIESYIAKFQTQIDPQYEGDDEVFLIDKNETIDIKDMVLNAIKLQEPFTKKCEDCQKLDTQTSGDDEDDYDSFSSISNINFS